MKPPNEEYEMKRILIVEDDMALAQELQYLLISNQYDAQCVAQDIGYSGHYGDKQKHRDGRSDLDELRCG